MRPWPSELEELCRDGRAVCVATIVQANGSTPREAGAKMFVESDGTLHGSIGGGQLEELARQDAIACLAQEAPALRRYPLGAKAGQCCGGTVDIFFEVINIGPTLLLFGAGHVGQALCRVLDGTTFRVHVVDEREEWVHSPRLPDSVHRHAFSWDEVIDQLPWNAAHTFVCVMTHRHDVDEAIVREAIQRPAHYIGLIGSETKWRKIRARLLDRGRTEEELSRVKCPIGLPIGGKAPAAVAVSIAAELLQRFHRR